MLVGDDGGFRDDAGGGGVVRTLREGVPTCGGGFVGGGFVGVAGFRDSSCGPWPLSEPCTCMLVGGLALGMGRRRGPVVGRAVGNGWERLGAAVDVGSGGERFVSG